MTGQDTFLIIAAGLLAVWWLVKNPEAAKVVGALLLFGLVCFGVAHAQTHERQRHCRRYGRGYQRRHYRRRW
jgi:hypothetical protein